ncbi:MAG: TonB-dependent receptor [Chitinophagales bacterium]
MHRFRNVSMKNRLRSWVCLLAVLLPLTLISQTNYTISGYVKDTASGETLLGANVYVLEDISAGVSTNLYGFYSITLPEGEYNLLASYVGYEKFSQKISLKENLRININLKGEQMLEEVVIAGEPEDKNVQSTEMGTIDLSIEQVKSIPVLFGEVDILKTLQLLPGVSSASEGNTGFYVRGGGPDQNLILLDDAVVYNTGHLFGFFSVFNGDAIKNTTLIKGGMPAQYGGRLSSVVDVQMKDGNNQTFHAEGGIGLIASRLTLEGPIQKNKSSFIVSARRTYIDAIITPFLKETDFEGNAYYFYDLNTKVNYQFTDKDRLYASGYFGRDVFNYSSPDNSFQVEVPWGNATATLRWNHLYSDKLFSNVSLIYNDYNFAVSSAFDDFDFRLYSGVRDWNAKIDYDYFLNKNNTIKFGANYIYHTFTPYSAEGTSGDVEFSTDSLNKKYAHEASIYLQDEFDLGALWKFNVGIRGSYFLQVGPWNDIRIDSLTGLPSDTISYTQGEPIADYWGLEPRMNLRYIIDENSSIKAGVTFTNQFIHLVSNSVSTLPTDLWVPSSAKVNPQKGIQYSAGYFRNFSDNMFETSIEVYFKDLQNQIEYRDGYVPELNEDIENNFVFGDGRSYGAELFIKKAKGDFNGWIGYTLSKTERYFPQLSTGENWFPTKYDRIHDVEVVTIYDITERVSLSGTFVYSTGQATTIVESFYFLEGELQTDYGPRNGYRLAPYHRLDLSCTLKGKPHEKYESSWNFSVYNVYNRKNPYFIYTDYEGDFSTGSVSVRAVQVSIFPIIPSITWNFKW